MKKLRNRNKRFSYNKGISLILLLLSFFMVGFAYTTNGVSIKGDAVVSNNAWSVHLEKGFTMSNDVEEDKEPTILNKTDLNFSINLKSESSFYEVYVYVVNDGYVDAQVSEIIYGSLPDDVKDYVSFTMEYGDGEEVQISDILPAGDYEQIKITVKLAENAGIYWILNHPELTTSDRDEEVSMEFNIDFSCSLKYEPVTKDGRIRTKTSLIQSLSLDEKAIKTLPSFITAPTAATSGLYVAPNTVNDKYPIYYYRGIVEDNNVIFAGFCWKIVRTTELGGTKLIYNGAPTNGQCTATGASISIGGTTAFNSSDNSLADVGYMYGQRLSTTSLSYNTTYIYGNDVTYDEDTRTYTLVDTSSTTAYATPSDDIQRHYTCLSATESKCNVVYYVVTYSSPYAYAYILAGQKNIEELKDLMFRNDNESTVLQTLNTWYETNIENNGYTSYLEDAVWCNDRSIVAGALTSKDSPLLGAYAAYFGANYYDTTTGKGRALYATTAEQKTYINPGFKDEEACPNVNDRFTTKNANYGNKALKYPVGLLTADEVSIAGNNYNGYSNSAYLYELNMWTMTPSSFHYNSTLTAHNFFLSTYNSYSKASTKYYLRPSIVLKAYTKVSSGSGTKEDPYIIAQ